MDVRASAERLAQRLVLRDVREDAQLDLRVVRRRSGPVLRPGRMPFGSRRPCSVRGSECSCNSDRMTRRPRRDRLVERCVHASIAPMSLRQLSIYVDFILCSSQMPEDKVGGTANPCVSSSSHFPPTSRTPSCLRV